MEAHMCVCAFVGSYMCMSCAGPCCVTLADWEHVYMAIVLSCTAAEENHVFAKQHCNVGGISVYTYTCIHTEVWFHLFHFCCLWSNTRCNITQHTDIYIYLPAESHGNNNLQVSLNLFVKPSLGGWVRVLVFAYFLCMLFTKKVSVSAAQLQEVAMYTPARRYWISQKYEHINTIYCISDSYLKAMEGMKPRGEMVTRREMLSRTHLTAD